MLILVEGTPGAGKSYTLVKDYVLPSLMDGRIVVTNIPLNLQNIEKAEPAAMKLLHPVGGRMDPCLQTAEELKKYLDMRDSQQRGPMLVIDEAHLSYPSGKTPTEVIGLFTMSRHHGSDVVFATQQRGQMSKTLVNLCENFIKLQPGRATGLGAKTYRRTVRISSGARDEPISNTLQRYDKNIFKWYHSRIGGVEEGVQKSHSLWKRMPIVLAVCVGVPFLIYSFYGAYQVIGGFIRGDTSMTRSQAKQKEAEKPKEGESKVPSSTVAVVPRDTVAAPIAPPRALQGPAPVSQEASASSPPKVDPEEKRRIQRLRNLILVASAYDGRRCRAIAMDPGGAPMRLDWLLADDFKAVGQFEDGECLFYAEKLDGSGGRRRISFAGQKPREEPREDSGPPPNPHPLAGVSGLNKIVEAQDVVAPGVVKLKPGVNPLEPAPLFVPGAAKQAQP